MTPGPAAAARHRRLADLVVGAPPSPAETAGAPGGPPGSGGSRARLTRLCSLAVAELGVDGAGVTVLAGSPARDGTRTQLGTVGDLTARLDELQLTTGEGPCLEAHETGVPVLVPDLGAERGRWLGFTAEALAIGACALFSFPLQVGAARLGTLDLNRRAPGSLSADRLADGLALAALATELLLALVETASDPSDGGPDGQPGVGWLPDVHAEVHVASGMVAAYTGTDVRDALLQLRSYAFRTGVPLHEVARRVIDRDLVLDPPDQTSRPENGAP
ncbi:GAF and ANTAR domain-containing protein [Actinomycetospora atypica]|uniref:GAF and ANTAR domain-containing protein n=1 Tax=Actinomycetospora atypica TaxID=1290095 RepID=A0ABV9YNW4_9PSEU